MDLLLLLMFLRVYALVLAVLSVHCYTHFFSLEGQGHIMYFLVNASSS